MTSQGGYPRSYRETRNKNLRKLKRELIFEVLQDLWKLFENATNDLMVREFGG